jgi:hypothetical protein
LEDKSIDKILDILTSFARFDKTIDNIFSINLVQNSIEPLLEKVTPDLDSYHIDPVQVDVSEWNQNAWNEVATNVKDVCKQLSTFFKDTEITSFEDLTDILTNTEKLDTIAQNACSMVDLVRANKLLRNSDNKSIFDKALVEYKLDLPEGNVEKVDGTTTTITNYTELYQFLAPAIAKVSSTDIYNKLTGSGDKIQAIADIVSAEGNENILKEILLPLYQYNFTKEAVFDNALNTISSDLLNFATLTSYADWKSDLGYIQTILNKLNTLKIGDKTYLQLAQEADGIDTIVANITDDDIDAIFTPVFHAKSTAGLKDKLVASIKTVLDDVTKPVTNTFDRSTITLTEGDSEDQTAEICNIFKKFVGIKDSYSTGDGMLSIDKAELGLLLDAMQKNAYRTTLSSKTEEGLFKGAFVNVVNKLKNVYATYIPYVEAEKGAGYMNESNYANINFIEVMSIIAAHS